MLLHVETRREAADRLSIAAVLKIEADRATRVTQAYTADAILGRGTVEHVTCWTDSHGRAKHETRLEVPS